MYIGDANIACVVTMWGKSYIIKENNFHFTSKNNKMGGEKNHLGKLFGGDLMLL